MEDLVGAAVAVVRHVEQHISDAGLKPGDRLPTERALAAATGVSRAVVRTALNELANRGVVLRHVGRGTFLAPDGTAGTAGGDHLPSPSEIMASRMVLEPELMPLAVISATGADLAEMERCLRAGEQAATSEEFERWDTALHHSFAVATHNAVLVDVSSLLIAARRQPVWGSLKKRTFGVERHRSYCREHERIVAAIRERDADAAREAMKAHLKHVRSTLMGNSD